MNMGVGKRAFVTFLAGDGDYVKGVVGLAKGLRKANTRYPLMVAVLPDVPDDHRRILRSQGCIVREIEPVYPPENQTKFVRAYFVINYSKLRLWENWRCSGCFPIAARGTEPNRPEGLYKGAAELSFTLQRLEEYEKMMYLDADIQVFDNIDHLFDSSNGYFYAVMDCFCDKEWRHSPQYKIGYCQQCPDKVEWPADMGLPPPLYFNAGMFIFEPNLVTYSNLLEALKVTPTTSFAEQDFLNMFFKDVYKPIPNVYNLLVAMLWRHPENVDVEKVKVVHYSAEGAKPWRYTGEKENMEREDIKMWVKKWWDIYEDESLDYENTTKNIVEEENHCGGRGSLSLNDNTTMSLH